jgi:hypothetical protein
MNTAPTPAMISLIKSLPVAKRLAAAKWAETEFFGSYASYIEFHGHNADRAEADRAAWSFAILSVKRKFAA